MSSSLVCEHAVCASVHLYIQGGSDVFWECWCSFVFLRLSDGGAPEQMWHLNGLLLGKQVAECDRS